MRDIRQELGRRILCSYIGGVGGVVGAFLLLVVSEPEYLIWRYLEAIAPMYREVNYLPSPGEEQVLRTVWGFVFGAFVGLTQRRSFRRAFWTGLVVSFVLFSLAPWPSRIRE
jgi:hypothetical protein